MSEETFTKVAKDVAKLVNQGHIQRARSQIVNLVLKERDEERQASRSEAELQVDQLASFIMAEIAGEPSQNEGAVDTAIRVMRTRQTEPNAAEALFLFMGWLTSRDEGTGPFSSRHHAAEAANLVAEYYEGQGWTEPREGWEKIVEVEVIG